MVVGELGNEAELPEKLSSNLDSDRQVEVTDLAEPELIDPVPEIYRKYLCRYIRMYSIYIPLIYHINHQEY